MAIIIVISSLSGSMKRHLHGVNNPLSNPMQNNFVVHTPIGEH